MHVKFYQTGEGKAARIRIALRPDKHSSTHRDATEHDKKNYSGPWAEFVEENKVLTPPKSKKAKAVAAKEGDK